MLSDNPSIARLPSKPRRSVKRAKAHWSDSQKIEAAQTYLILGGNARLTAATLKIPEDTFHYWKSQEWWKELMRELRTQERLTLSARLKKVVEKSLELVEDRLEKGDFIYDQKTGELRRKPVGLRDVHKVASDLLERKEKLDAVQEFSISQESIEDKLTKLAESFKKLANQTKEPVTINVTDVIMAKEQLDALDEEREEGLQEGV